MDSSDTGITRKVVGREPHEMGFLNPHGKRYSVVIRGVECRYVRTLDYYVTIVCPQFKKFLEVAP